MMIEQVYKNDGFEVHVEMSGEAVNNMEILKDLVNRSLSGTGLHVCMTRHGNVAHFQSSNFNSWSREIATKVNSAILGCLDEFHELFSQRKLKRQVRDALNKCEDPEVLEEIAKILRVKKFIPVGVEQAE